MAVWFRCLGLYTCRLSYMCLVCWGIARGRMADKNKWVDSVTTISKDVNTWYNIWFTLLRMYLEFHVAQIVAWFMTDSAESIIPAFLVIIRPARGAAKRSICRQLKNSAFTCALYWDHTINSYLVLSILNPEWDGNKNDLKMSKILKCFVFFISDRICTVICWWSRFTFFV